MRVFPAPAQGPMIDPKTWRATMPWERWFKAAGDQLVAAAGTKGDSAMRWSVHGCVVHVSIQPSSVDRVMELPHKPAADSLLVGSQGIAMRLIQVYEGQASISVPAGCLACGSYFFQGEN